MPYRTKSIPGDYNVVCDWTGRKYKRSQCRRTWDGHLVRRESWEQRHPQDFVRGVADHQSVPPGEARPFSTPEALPGNIVTPDDL